MHPVVYVLSERSIDMILYTMLAMAIILYLAFIMPGTGSVYMARDTGYIFIGSVADTIDVNRPGGCSCDGAERMTVSMAGEYMDDQASAVDVDQREDASSIHIGETEKEKKHDISSNGWHLYADLDEKLMYVYRDGQLIRTYEVSGGKPSSPSPLGTWRIIGKDTWGEGFGGAWLGFNVPWGKYGIHGTTDPWAVGKINNSKGCIRMRNDEVRELYRLVPHNALVTVVYENRPFYPMRDGDVGSDVLAVERALKKLVYYHGGEDGIFGSSLKKAVLEFQKDYNLYRTGVVNNSTYEKIMELEKEYDEEQERNKREREEILREPEQ